MPGGTESGMLVARGLVKSYAQGDAVQVVLDGVDFGVDAGTFTSIMGPSGSGKSTLLHLLGGLDVPDRGDVVLDGVALSALSDDDRTRLRRDRIGIVYQFYNLVPVLTVEENVALPAVISGRSPGSYRARLDEVIELVGLGDHRTKQPSQLSGGQQQRAAIARALFIEPTVLLADEPTGNLDLKAGAEILHLFADAQRAFGQTIVMVTHDPRSAGYGDAVLMLRDGRMVDRLDLVPWAGDGDGADTAEERGVTVLRWLERLNTVGGSEMSGPGPAATPARRPRSGGGDRRAKRPPVEPTRA